MFAKTFLCLLSMTGRSGALGDPKLKTKYWLQSCHLQQQLELQCLLQDKILLNGNSMEKF